MNKFDGDTSHKEAKISKVHKNNRHALFTVNASIFFCTD